MSIYIYDTTGPAPDMSRPQGGSETATALLAGALNALVLTGPQGFSQANPVPCDTLILQRWTQKPAWIYPRRILVSAHDLYRREYDYARSIGAHVICVSEYQRASFLSAGFHASALAVIHPILGEHVKENLGATKSEGRWLYPTAANKGLAASLVAWEVDSDSPRHIGGRLVVTSSGYDFAQEVSALTARYQARYLLHQNPAWLAAQIAISEGLWYVNTAPEAFPMTIAIAKYYNLDLSRVRCQGHTHCGIQEAIMTPSETLTAANIKAQWEKYL